MLTIYGIPVSVHTRKVIVTALEKRIAYRIQSVIPFQPPAGWSELSPTGKIPVVTDGDVLLRDSSAICAYLERMYSTPALYPADPVAYAQALFFEEYADGTLFPEVVRPLFFQKIIRPQILGQSMDQAAIDQVLYDALPKAFGYLNGEVARDVLAGAEFSIADVALMSNLLNFHYLGMQIDARYSHLQRYFRAHAARQSFKTAFANEAEAAVSLGLDLTAIAA